MQVRAKVNGELRDADVWAGSSLLSMLRESYGDGPVVFDGEALVGLGVKS